MNEREQEIFDAVNRLEEIQDEMLELISEADGILSRLNIGVIYKRAELYWIAHIKSAIRKRSREIGITMDDTLKELRSEVE